VWWWGGAEPPAELRQPLTAPEPQAVGGTMLPSKAAE
jgi:hypothetical protein